MSRKLARESVYKLVFEFLFLNEVNQRTFNILSSIELADSDREYMQRAYFGVIQKKKEIMQIIEELSEGFTLERIFKPDLAALMLAIYEMKYMEDIPLSVSIAEAVEIVKRYSTDKSNQYVNGVLSTVYKQLTQEQEKGEENDHN
ncbi:MAG: transcription antitermination factor NusB [Bacillota bacterium]|jgi:N utilization substance protein B|nr:transcription antitermination factor NusB [Bacillota bacterium]HHU43179.1 transcription antitermination factor NusB [Clostridiales bacterium]